MSLFGKKPRNELASVILTDSTLKSLTTSGRNAVLQLVDYCDSLVEIRFVGVSRILVPEPVDGVEVMDVSFRWDGDKWLATLKDDDGETVLEVAYETTEFDYVTPDR